ncbi:methyltransferase domain-containing protein [Fibrobacterota bacterium]
MFWDTFGIKKVQYGCGRKFLHDWVNLDYINREELEKNQGLREDDVYYKIDLTMRQPFPDGHFEYAFSEDFLEHLNQSDSLIFLCECYRTLSKGGVLRLGFPGLENVLTSHFPETDFKSACLLKEQAYARHQHLHFYSRKELELVALHIGFSEVRFADYRISEFKELRGLDTRENQKNMNTYVELIK